VQSCVGLVICRLKYQGPLSPDVGLNVEPHMLKNLAEGEATSGGVRQGLLSSLSAWIPSYGSV